MSITPTLERARTIVTHPHTRRGLIELGLVFGLYLTYSASRTLASTDLLLARRHGGQVLEAERLFHADVEQWLNHLVASVDWLGVAASFWYATTHYLVTAGLLLWLWFRHPREYLPARRTLVLSTVVGLAFYLLVPTAPPRLMGGGWTDVLARHADVGWWGADASAPRGMGHLTNELAAFPSLHAGWALWAVVVVLRVGVPRWVAHVGAAYALGMALVVVGTGNHWVLDVLVGWLVVLWAYAAVVWLERHSLIPWRAARRDRTPAAPDAPPRP